MSSAKIVITKPGKTASYDTHEVVEMRGTMREPDGESGGVAVYDLENAAAKAFVHGADITYTKAYITAGYSTTKYTTTNGTKYKPEYDNLICYNRKDGEGGWTDQDKPVVIGGTTSGHTLTLTSEEHTLTLPCAQGATVVHNLVPGQTYTWSESGTTRGGTFKTTGQLRMLKIGMPNCRDLGGWPCDGGTVKYGKLIRGMGLSFATGTVTQVDAELHPQIMQELTRLGVGTDLDLRTSGTSWSSLHDPGYAAAGYDIEWVNVPTAGYYADLENTAIKTALEAVARGLDKGKAVWFHCSTAADRGGTLSAILLAVAGCDIDSVVKDYDLTRFNCMGYGLPELNKAKQMGCFLSEIYRKTKNQTYVDAVVGAGAAANELRDKMITWLMGTIGVKAQTLRDIRYEMTGIESGGG